MSSCSRGKTRTYMAVAITMNRITELALVFAKAHENLLLVISGIP